MNQRLFMKVCSSTCAAIIAGGAWLTVLQRVRGLSYSDLPENMKALYQQEFAKAFPALKLEDLVAELGRRDVYREWRFDVSQIRANASSDPLVEFDNFLYTESELLLYAMVARLREGGSVFLE